MENPEIAGVEYQRGTLFGCEAKEYLLNKWNRQCAYCSAENVPLQIEHIQPKSKGGSDRIANLCLACEKCNQKKGSQDIRQFLKKKPEVLERILAQAKRPLKDAAAVNTTRWALFNALKQTGLTVTTGSGGQTKFNRTRLGLPKAHWMDAACAGQVSSLQVLVSKPLVIKATGHGNRKMCATNKLGFPKQHRTNQKRQFGFQTGDLVRAVIPRGKYIGTWFGRITVRAKPCFDLSSTKKFSVNPQYLVVVHRDDGYNYSL